MSGIEDNNLYEFGEFRLDARESVLRRGEEMITLPPKVYETLFLLVKKQGGIISKTEMLNTIWADSFVEESNLTQNIYTLRKILGKNETGKQLIETVARRGYRIAVPVKILNLDEVASFHGTNSKNNFLAAPENFYAPELSVEEPENNSDSFPSGEFVGVAETAKPSVETLTPPAAAAESGRRVFWQAALIFGCAVVILSAASAGIYYFSLATEEKETGKIAPIEQLKRQPLTNSGDVVYPTISPNGEMLAFVRLEDEVGSVWVKQIATDTAREVLPPSVKSYRSLAFSPDGKYLFFRQEADPSAIYQTTIWGGTPKKVAENVWSDFSVSPDGRQFAFIRRDPEQDRYLVILSNLDGSGERELGVKQSPAFYRSAPAFSPDGTKITVAAGIEAQFLPKLLMIEIADGTETEMKIPNWRAVQKILWMPDGKNLIISARDAKEPYSQLWLLPYPEGEVRRLSNDLEAYFWISLSSDGRMLVTRQQRIFSHLYLLPDGDLKKAKQLTSGIRNMDGYMGLAVTPGEKIVYTSFANNITDIFMMNADGTERVQLTKNAGQDNNYPAVSPDGRVIVFTSNRSGTAQIWRMDIDGRNQRQLTFVEDKKERIQSPAFSADGSRVYYIKRKTGQSSFWSVPVEGGEPVEIPQTAGASPEGFLSVSPDGQHIVYHHIAEKSERSGENQSYRIGVIPTGAGGAPKIFELPMRRPFVRWASETAFDFSSGAYNSSKLMRQSLNGKAPQKLIDFPDRLFNFAWSPDGKNLVVARGRQHGDAVLITNLP